VISHLVLIVAEPLGGLSAERVAGALGRGIQAGDRGLSVDVLAAEHPQGAVCEGDDGAEQTQLRGSAARAWWSSSESTARLRAARAVVIAAARLDERTLAGSVAFEVATSARQAGVPAYAVTAENALDPFDARMLDLQVILQARGARALRSAGAKLAGLV
jgi:hypothetical protein